MAYNMIDSIKTEMKIRRDMRNYGRKNPEHYQAEIEQRETLHALVSLFLPFINIFVNMFFFRLMWQTLCDHPFIIYFLVTIAYAIAYMKLLKEDIIKNGLMYLLGIFLASTVVGTSFPDRSGLGFGLYLFFLLVMSMQFIDL